MPLGELQEIWLFMFILVIQIMFQSKGKQISFKRMNQTDVQLLFYSLWFVIDIFTSVYYRTVRYFTIDHETNTLFLSEQKYINLPYRLRMMNWWNVVITIDTSESEVAANETLKVIAAQLKLCWT